MTKNDSESYGWGSYKSFRKEFDKRTWNREGRGNGWWCREDNSKVFAGIVKFGGKGMLLYPIESIRVKLFLHRLQNIVKWEE